MSQGGKGNTQEGTMVRGYNGERAGHKARAGKRHKAVGQCVGMCVGARGSGK